MNVKTSLKWDGDVVKLRGKKVINKSSFETGLIVEGQAKLLCPVAGGRLAASITTQSLTQSSGAGISKPTKLGETHVGTNVEYAPHVEFGTVAHKISVKSKKALSDGKSVFGKTVNHPGTQEQPFLRPALALAKGKVLTIVKKNSKYIFGDYLE